MPVTVWKGHLTFGLVSIPVRLFRAARAQRVSLRQLYRPTARHHEDDSIDALPQRATTAGKRQREEEDPPPSLPVASEPVVPVKRVYQPANDTEQPRPIRESDLVKGYEVAKGEYVVLDEQELRSVAPKTSTEMEIVEFVRFSEIDPVYLETSYYVAPDEGGEKAYALLLKRMEETGYGALGQVTMHRRDHVMILRPGKTGLLAHTMFYADEVRTVDEFRTNTELVSPKELDLAKTLIQALATSFEPEKFRNQFRERLRQLIESRAATRQIATVEAPPAKVIDIMDALKRSLAQAKSAGAAEPETAKPERKPATGERSAKKATPWRAR
jgi:DNA end-binding protein Ku